MNDSKDVQDAESVCSSGLSYLPSKPAIVPSPRRMPCREYCQRPVFDTRNLREISGDVSENPAARIDLGTLVYGGLLFGRIPVSRFDGSAFKGTGKLVAGSDEMNRDTITTRQLGRLHLMQKECIHKVVWLNIKDSKSRNCVSTNSLHFRRFQVGE